MYEHGVHLSMAVAPPPPPGADPGFSFRGGGRTSAEPNSLSAGVQGPLKVLGSSGVVLMLFRAIWALFLSILIKKLDWKKHIVDPSLGGAYCPPPPWIRHCWKLSGFLMLSLMLSEPHFKAFWYKIGRKQNRRSKFMGGGLLRPPPLKIRHWSMPLWVCPLVSLVWPSRRRRVNIRLLSVSVPQPTKQEQRSKSASVLPFAPDELFAVLSLMSVHDSGKQSSYF